MIGFYSMASQVAQPKAIICPEKLELERAFLEAVRDLMKLQEQQSAVLVETGQTLDRFNLALERARNRREHARKLYLLHIRTHGC